MKKKNETRKSRACAATDLAILTILLVSLLLHLLLSLLEALEGVIREGLGLFNVVGDNNVVVESSCDKALCYKTNEE